jgi:hypothetical protein
MSSNLFIEEISELNDKERIHNPKCKVHFVQDNGQAEIFDGEKSFHMLSSRRRKAYGYFLRKWRLMSIFLHIGQQVPS